MVELIWTTEAEKTLRQIYDAMARDRPTTARRTIESLLDRVDSLAKAPHLGLPHSFRSEVLLLTYGRFQVPYSLLDGRLIVLGVFHGPIFLPP